MSGSIDMGAQTITNVSSVSTSSANINIGYSNTLLTTGTVLIGASNSEEKLKLGLKVKPLVDQIPLVFFKTLL
jgi:hypothetical protein